MKNSQWLMLEQVEQQNKVEISPPWVHTDINIEKKRKKEMVEIKQNPHGRDSK